MTPTGGLPTGLAFLTHWLTDTPENSKLETSLSEWVRSSGFTSAGLAWPVEGTLKCVLNAKPELTEASQHPPVETSDVVKSLQSGSSTVLWQLPGTAGRLYTLLTPPGLAPGLLWAERSAKEPWTDLDRSYLMLSARMLERSIHLGKTIGPILDPVRIQQRLADASIIAGRMAHDFDNILTGIIGFADLTIPQLTPGTQPAKFVSEISKVGTRGTIFTQQLHQFSRSGQTKPQSGSLAIAIANEESRLKGMMPSGLNYVVNLPSHLAPVAMDIGPLQAVLGHILENAVEASAANGRIYVTAKHVELNWNDVKGYLGQANVGAHLEISIHDNGHGIKNEVRQKLFVEPFYTTKVRHRGLGLAIVYRILFAHRGGIRIDAAAPPETGTTVRVIIPLVSARAAVSPTAIIGSTAH
jgi:signal transduction histidine kinase